MGNVVILLGWMVFVKYFVDFFQSAEKNLWAVTILLRMEVGDNEGTKPQSLENNEDVSRCQAQPSTQQPHKAAGSFY